MRGMALMRGLALSGLMLALATAASCKNGGLEARPEAPASSRVEPQAQSTRPAHIAQAYAVKSGHLLIRNPEALRAQVAARSPAWRMLKENVDRRMGRADDSHTSAENIALVYLLTGDKRYAAAAMARVDTLMKKDDVRRDSYLYYGDSMRPVAMVLDYCAKALSQEEKGRLAAYLHRWTQELWHANKGSGWGLADPGNNYHLAFLEGTAFAGYALKAHGHPEADAHLRLLRNKLEAKGGVLDYLDQRGEGGDWPEGANYGERSKQRLFSTLSVVAAGGGPNYFNKSPFFADSVRYAVYQLQPDKRSLYPAGDLARNSAMMASPFERDYLQQVAFWSDDADTKALVAWYLKEVMPSYSDRSLNWPAAFYKDVLFPLNASPAKVESLPLSYRAKATGWVSWRSDWGRDATSVAIAGASIIDQSHAHHDVGSFTIFKGGWQALDAATLSRSGLSWEAGAHNMIHVDGHERRGGKLKGLVRFAEGAGFGYVQIDATAQFRKRHSPPLLKEHSRELVYLKPDTLLVYDRVSAAAAKGYSQRLHLAEKPNSSKEGYYQARNGRGGLSMVQLVGGKITVRQDDDLADGASKAWRVEVAPKDKARGRFLSVLKVGLGKAPLLSPEKMRCEGDVEGVAIDGWGVVFSKRSQGASGESASCRHDATLKGLLLLNMRGSYQVDRQPGQFRFSRGAGHKADDNGLIVLH